MSLGTSRPRSGDNAAQLRTRIALEHLARGASREQALNEAAKWRRAKYADIRAEFVRLANERMTRVTD